MIGGTDFVPALPETFEVCVRCKSHVLWPLPGNEKLWCYQCGSTEPGIPCEQQREALPRPCPLCGADLLDGAHEVTNTGQGLVLSCPTTPSGQMYMFNLNYLQGGSHGEKGIF